MRPFRFIPHALLLSLLGSILCAPRASAETPLARPTPSQEFALKLEAVPPPPEPPDLVGKVRRRRLLLAIGIGTVVGSAISLAVLGTQRTGCEGQQQVSMSLVGTGLVGGIGLSLAIGGGVGLARLPTRTRMSIPSAGWMLPVGVGAALGGFVHAFAIALPQALCPISS